MAALSTIKERLAKLKDAIEASEERESEAKNLLKDAEAREEANLNEAESMRRRITLLEQELGKTEARLEEAEDRLDSERTKTSTHEEVRRGLEDYELEGDEKIQDLECKLKDEENKEKECSDRLTEAQRREVVLQIDLNKAIKKGDSFEDRIEELTEQLEKGAEQVKLLEENEEEKFEREEENEEKVKFLEEQVKQFVQRYDTAEREIQKLERIMDQIQTEIYHYNDLAEDQRKEIQEINDMDIFDD